MSQMQQAWIDFCEELKGSVDYIFADDQVTESPIDEAEGVRHVVRSLVKACLATFENADPRLPELAWFHPSKMGLDNPDALYQSAPIDLVHDYEFSGNIGSVAYLGIALMSMKWGTGDFEFVRNIHVSELGADENGDFTVTLSSRPDPGTTGHPWFELPAKRTSLLVRQFFSDWESESLAALSLRCLSEDPPESRITPEQLASKLLSVAAEVNRVPPFWNRYYREHIARGEVNSFEHIEPTPPEDVGSLGGATDQAYAECWYAIAPGEALLIEVEIPECVYWNVQLGDIWGQSTDWVNRQSSLDAGQAVLDNGILRVVVCEADPGYNNWLDLGGCTQGQILFRWNQANVIPKPVARLLAAEDLPAAMPESETVLTIEARSAALARRRRAALARFRR